MEKLLMGSIFVFAFSTLASYILIVLNISFLIIPVFLISLFLFKKDIYKILKNIKIKLNSQSFILFFVFLAGIIGQLAIIAPSGLKNKDGDIIFYSSHGHDGMWHIALMNEIKKGFPFEMPVFNGEKLTNYHFFSDILPAVFSKYLKINDLDLYFRIFPSIYSIFFGASVYFLTYKITKNYNASVWATIFGYFAGSFGYLIGKGESVFWATQPQSSSGNLPQIISNFLYLAAIYYILIYLEQKDYKNKIKFFFISLTIIISISSFKIYAGVILLGSLSILGLWKLIFKKDSRLFLLSLISGLITLALYIPNSSGKNFLIFEPWWYIRTMVVEPSRLNLLDWELKRQTYIVEGNWKRVIWLEGVSFLIFFFGNLGMRFLGLWQYFKSNNIFKISILLSLLLPLLFLQRGVASNTSQFLQYFILLFGILAGIQTAKIMKKLKKPLFCLLFGFIVFLLIIPTQVQLIYDFYKRPAFAKIDFHEIEALNFIKEEMDKNSVILTPPYNQYLDQKQTTPNIWDWFDTSYVSAFSDRRTYFDDYEQVDIMGYDYKSRLKIKETIFNEKDINKVKEAVSLSRSNLIYFPKDLKPITELDKIGLSKIYENSVAEIWKTN